MYFKHKSRNKDLPLFIKEYLSQLAPRIKVLNFKEIEVKIKEETQKGEIDVYIQKNRIGFECKLFVNPTPIESQMRSYVNEVFEEIKKYLHYRVNRIVVVTNLSEKDAQSMKQRIISKLKEENLSADNFEVLPASIQKLLQLLKNEVDTQSP